MLGLRVLSERSLRSRSRDASRTFWAADIVAALAVPNSGLRILPLFLLGSLSDVPDGRLTLADGGRSKSLVSSGREAEQPMNSATDGLAVQHAAHKQG